MKKPKKTNLEWTETIIPLEDKPRCKHYFEFVERGECKCRKCGLGLIGVLELKNGKPV